MSCVVPRASPSLVAATFDMRQRGSYTGWRQVGGELWSPLRGYELGAPQSSFLRTRLNVRVESLATSRSRGDRLSLHCRWRRGVWLPGRLRRPSEGRHSTGRGPSPRDGVDAGPWTCHCPLGEGRLAAPKINGGEGLLIRGRRAGYSRSRSGPWYCP